jgi:molybdopterin-guanine dinucleotide biosynthesis protein A
VTGYTAVVLAGGRARRLGGIAKPAVDVGGRPMLARVLAAVADAGHVIVVGPPLAGLAGPQPVWTREDPPGAGPVAALRAAVALLPPGAGTVVVLAADLPFLDAATVARLRAAVTEPGATGPDAAGPGEAGTGATVPGAAVLVDDGGRDQYLAAAWTATALRQALSTVEDDRMSSVYAAVPRVDRVAATGYRAGVEPWRDVDDPVGLDRARASWEHSRQDDPTPQG